MVVVQAQPSPAGSIRAVPDRPDAPVWTEGTRVLFLSSAGPCGADLAGQMMGYLLSNHDQIAGSFRHLFLKYIRHVSCLVGPYDFVPVSDFVFCSLFPFFKVVLAVKPILNCPPSSCTSPIPDHDTLPRYCRLLLLTTSSSTHFSCCNHGTDKRHHYWYRSREDQHRYCYTYEISHRRASQASGSDGRLHVCVALLPSP